MTAIKRLEPDLLRRSLVSLMSIKEETLLKVRETDIQRRIKVLLCVLCRVSILRADVAFSGDQPLQTIPSPI